MRRILPILFFVSLGVTACFRSTSGSIETQVSPSPTTSPTVAPSPDVTPTSSPVQQQRMGTVTADVLNIRQSAGTNAPILYSAPRGTQLEILGDKAMGDSLWYEVKAVSSQFPQSNGWAFSQYVTVSSETTPSEPNMDSLSMTCTGTLSNGTNFTVNYTREAGFNQITLNPNSETSNSATLTYSGKTDAQHGVWKGKLSESEVRVDHLSTAAPKPGDSINVVYNLFNGRGTCR